MALASLERVESQLEASFPWKRKPLHQPHGIPSPGRADHLTIGVVADLGVQSEPRLPTVEPEVGYGEARIPAPIATRMQEKFAPQAGQDHQRV